MYREVQGEYLDTLKERLATLDKRVSVALVEPKYSGNIGSVARAMHNCGLSDLILINPIELTEDAFKFSMHSKDILEKCRRFASLSEVTGEFRFVVGTSSVQTFNGRKFRRVPVEPAKFWKSALNQRGKILLVFGREDDGLRNTEIEQCNTFVHIEANPEYPVFNLSHSVAIILYEMLNQVIPAKKAIKSDTVVNTDLVANELIKSMNLSGYPDYKRKNASVMLKRLVSRMGLTDTEYHKLMGILKYISRQLGDTDSADDSDSRK